MANDYNENNNYFTISVFFNMGENYYSLRIRHLWSYRRRRQGFCIQFLKPKLLSEG